MSQELRLDANVVTVERLNTSFTSVVRLDVEFVTVERLNIIVGEVVTPPTSVFPYTFPYILS